MCGFKMGIRQRYYRVLARHPWVVLVLTVLIVALMGVVTYIQNPADHWKKNLEDPTLGIEVRGSLISGTSFAIDNLLSSMPDTYNWLPNNTVVPVASGENIYHLFTDVCQSKLERRSDPWIVLKGEDDWHSRFVFEATDGQSLFSANHLRAVCQLEDDVIRSYFRYDCRAHSLGMYVAALNGKTCDVITDDDVQRVLGILQKCYIEYESGYLQGDCTWKTCPQATPQCYRHNAVYNIFYYLTDKDFVQDIKDKVDDPFLRYTMVILHGKYSETMREDFYITVIAKKKLTEAPVRLTGVDMGVRFRIFIHYFVQSLYFFILSAVLVVLVLALYMQSTGLVLAMLIAVPFSCVAAVFSYHLIFQFRVFPFLNVLAVVLLLVVWTGHVFVFFDMWQAAKAKVSSTCTTPLEQEENSSADDEKKILHDQNSGYGTLFDGSLTESSSTNVTDDAARDHNDVMEERIAHAFEQAALTIFASSLSTVGAMVSNYISSVMCIRCFSVFMGSCLVSNLLLMYTWIPACLVVSEQLGCNLGKTCRNSAKMSCFGRCLKSTKSLYWSIFDRYLPILITKAWFVFIILLLGAGVSGGIAIFYKPKLRLPTNVDFQLLGPSFKTENYALNLKYNFEFENPNSTRGMPLYFVWGIDRDDNSDFFDAFDHGTLRLHGDRDFYSSSAQTWLGDFCEDIKPQSFVSHWFSTMECTYKKYRELMDGDCPAAAAATSLQFPCCGDEEQGASTTTTTTNGSLLQMCVPDLAMYTAIHGKDPTIGQHVFDQSTGEVVAFVMRLNSSQRWTGEYAAMESLFNDIKSFMSAREATAPDALKGGWFHGRFEFYDLQRAFSETTFVSVACSIGVALVCILITTCNVIIALYATVTTILSILTTIGLLVMIGYELSLIEACLYCLVAGLSVDHTINYAVAFIKAEEIDSADRVRASLQNVGSSVTMACVATFLAGVGILGAMATVYWDVGIFLVVLTPISWIFSTFFFQSLCHIAGPRGDFLQLNCCGKRSTPEDIPLEQGVDTGVRSDEQDQINNNGPVREKYFDESD